MLKAVFWMMLFAALLGWWTPLIALLLVVMGIGLLLKACRS